MIKSEEIRNSFNIETQKKKKKAQEIATLLEKIWRLIPQSNEMAMTPEQVLNLVYPENITIPVDPFEIAKYFNIEINKYEDMKQKENEVLFDGRKIMINYKSSGCENADRFTIAHGLGHVFLHFLEGYKFDFKENNVSSEDRFEIEADEFARQLLVPKY